MQEIRGLGLAVDFNDSYLSKEKSDEIFEFCDKTVNWNPKMENRRSNVTFGETGLIYAVTFQENTVYRKAISWDTYPCILKLKKKVEATTINTAPNGYNFCAIMRYPSGNVAIKKHRDKEMVHGTSIVGISVGSTRRLQLTPPYEFKKYPTILHLTHGSIYCLLPPTNDRYVHEILKDTDAGVRYSLTFRNVPNAITSVPLVVKIKCDAILKSGLRKGEKCGATVKLSNANTCKRHS